MYNRGSTIREAFAFEVLPYVYKAKEFYIRDNTFLNFDCKS